MKNELRIMNRSKSIPGISNGFSTLEILLAMTISILTLTAVILVSFGGQSVLADSQASNEAINKAQEMLENQQALARKDFKLVVPTSTTEMSGGLQYVKAVTVTPSSTDFFTKLVTATISWMGDHTRNLSTSLSTIVTNFDNAVGGDTCSSVLTGNWGSPSVSNSTLGTLLGDATGIYPITDVEVYKKKMYVTVNTPSQNSDARNPTTAADSAAAGTIVWSSVNNIFSSDNSRATAPLSGTATTHYIKAINFGFSVPSGATILGISVSVERSRTAGSTGEARDSEVKIVKSSGTIGLTNKAATATNWPTSDANATYGGVADLWNQSDPTITWSAADINNANFGVVVAATGSSGTTNRTANIDNIQITVTYIKEFYILDLTNPAAPTFTAGLGMNSAIATGFNAVATDGHYAYIATNSGPAGGQLQIVDITATPPVIASTYILPTTGSGAVTGTGTQALGSTIFYKDGYIYLGLTKTATGPEFNLIDVHSPTTPSRVGYFSVGAGVEAVFIKDGWAYVATDDNAGELTILDVTDPTTLSSKTPTKFNPPQTSSTFGYGKSLYRVGDSLYLGRTWAGTTANTPEFYALNGPNSTSTVTTINVMGTNDIGPNSSNPFSVRGLIVRDYLAFLLTGSGNNGGSIKIINTSNYGTVVTTLALPPGGSGAGGVAMDCEGNYMYAASVDSASKGYITSVTAL